MDLELYVLCFSGSTLLSMIYHILYKQNSSWRLFRKNEHQLIRYNEKKKFTVIEVWKTIETTSCIYLKIENMNTFFEVQRVKFCMLNVDWEIKIHLPFKIYNFSINLFCWTAEACLIKHSQVFWESNLSPKLLLYNLWIGKIFKHRFCSPVHFPEYLFVFHQNCFCWLVTWMSDT